MNAGPSWKGAMRTSRMREALRGAGVGMEGTVRAAWLDRGGVGILRGVEGAAGRREPA
jgi:hypothetical protein